VLVENGPVFIALPLYNSSPTFWKSNNDQAHDFHVVSIEGYDTNGFFFRNSWGPDWGNNGCGYLLFIDWSRVVEAWVGVSRRDLVDSCQPSQSQPLYFLPRPKWAIEGDDILICFHRPNNIINGHINHHCLYTYQ